MYPPTARSELWISKLSESEFVMCPEVVSYPKEFCEGGAVRFFRKLELWYSPGISARAKLSALRSGVKCNGKNINCN